MLLPSLLKSGDQVYQKVIKQLYQKMLLLNLLITNFQENRDGSAPVRYGIRTNVPREHEKLSRGKRASMSATTYML